MAYVKTGSVVGSRVRLTKEISSFAGYFEKGTEVTVIRADDMRGYTFKDDEGNEIIECGWDGFEPV